MSETEIECGELSGTLPFRRQLMGVVGHIDANRGGAGIEFHRTRDYRHGDPVNRIDWHRLARTGELTTVEFDEEQAVSVVLVVDAQPSAYRGQPGDPHAVSYAISAARVLLQTLHAHRNWVGVAGVGRSFCWLAPSSGTEHLESADRLLTTHDCFSSTPPAGVADITNGFEVLGNRLGDAVQVVVFSPLCDDTIVESCLRFEAMGHAVTVVSPDVTTRTTPGGQLAALERSNRIGRLVRGGIAVFGWMPTEQRSVGFDASSPGAVP